jgi:hypothetical protein
VRLLELLGVVEELGTWEWLERQCLLEEFVQDGIGDDEVF